jgi:hypothetical protein
MLGAVLSTARELALNASKTLGLAATAVDLGVTIRPEPATAVDRSIAVTLPSRPSDPAAAPSSSRALPEFGSIPQLSLSLELPPAGREETGTSDIVLKSLLAEGGMGRVFLAEQRSLGRPVAVKTVRDAEDGAQAHALLTEGAITGYLEHPNVLPVHMLGHARTGEPVLVMKRIVGASWLELLQDDDHPAWSALLHTSNDRLAANLGVLMQIAAAAHHAHGAGLVHRDIKPENVMIGTTGEVYLVDWGIAMAGGQAASRLAGTPRFVAPEMVRCSTIDARTDVYLLGATLHFVLTGTPRHAGASLLEVLEAAVRSLPFAYDDEVPAELAALANDATAKDPADRPQDAAAFRARIAEFLSYRGAFALAGVAAERLAELRALRRGGKLDDPRLVRLSSEARFGFEQALAAHPAYERARTGVREVLVEQLALEIDRKNLAAARALVAELGDEAASFQTALAALEAEDERERAERGRLQQVERDNDVRPALRWIGACAAGLSVLSTVTQVLIQIFVGAQVRVRGTLIVGGFFTLVAFTTVAVLWRRLSANRASLHLALLVAGSIGVVSLHRLAALVAGDSAGQTLRDDLFILSVCCIGAGLFGHRRWLIGFPIMLAGGFIGALFPEQIVHVFGITTLVVLLLLSAQLWGQGPPPTDG